ncbi:hypothetical protein KAFR_0E01730 [Kazachstania africana CBS 2517]|uniref:Dolichol phosphate-mannose biosynthesis regulatory protein n=1 Tax=Kazachstania africana (strain ATCC 22294 / BCRC 22015 / CBS 2517 / CECT 1963 / NBRC 1671 / NRRL Y-8276) TaxID=1071382 RepID=H2AVC7_KAZAF|nr:hypothetical protein KAFR_0E01730 [Kazachstania africana CBS 2517]CCF58327.1 hypothetical protein KAFR_0E01730 [Kazachstania africana CBS 2517]
MCKFILLSAAAVYYFTWLLSQMFNFDNSFLFPIPSEYAIFLPIFLLIIAFMLVGTLLGLLLLANSEDDTKEKED